MARESPPLAKFTVFEGPLKIVEFVLKRVENANAKHACTCCACGGRIRPGEKRHMYLFGSELSPHHNICLTFHERRRCTETAEARMGSFLGNSMRDYPQPDTLWNILACLRKAKFKGWERGR